MGAGSTFSQGANPNTTNPYAGSTNPYAQAAQSNALGNLAGAQQATTANRVNQSTPYANLNYTQNADGTWSANQSLNGQLGGALNNISNNVANTTQNPFSADATQNQMFNANSPSFQTMGNAANLQTNVAGTGMQGWDSATQLLMNRLQPQMAQQKEQNDAQLANQGIVPGTQAYDNQMRTFNQGQNDLLTSAQMQGATLQNQMFNQNLQAGQFGNSALTQQNQNQLANTGLNNQYSQQGYTNALAGNQANNQALQNNYSQNLSAYNNPINQLGAFQQGTTPGYVNPYSQAAVSGPDYLGATTTSNAQQLAAQNAANAKTANTQSGLYGLGTAAVLGSGGLSGLAGLGSSAAGGLSSLSNWFNSLGFGNSGLTSGVTNGGVTGNTYDALGNLISSGNAAPNAADWQTAFGGTTGIDG